MVEVLLYYCTPCTLVHYNMVLYSHHHNALVLYCGVGCGGTWGPHTCGGQLGYMWSAQFNFTALHLLVLHYTALICNELKYTALQLSALHCRALHCIIHLAALHHKALHCTSTNRSFSLDFVTGGSLVCSLVCIRACYTKVSHCIRRILARYMSSVAMSS